jgi:hypothetical protein
MNTTTTTWIDSERCPACDTGLHCTDDGAGPVAQECPACGWTATSDLASSTRGSR